MDFDFTDDQSSLRDAVARWVEKGFSFERRHGIAKTGGHTRAVYAELAELGLTGLAVAPAHGGMGFGAIEAMVVCEELGRGLVNAPFAQGAVIAPLLLAAAPGSVQLKWLPKVAAGSALIVLAHQERGARYRLNHVQTRAVQDNGAWALSGTKSIVPAGDEADAWVVPARIAGGTNDAHGVGLFLVEKGAAGASVKGFPTQDGARAAQLDLQRASATLLAAEGLPLLEHAVDAGLAALCAEGVGAMDKLLALTVEYMNTRKQFGVPIASFQALRHRIADAKMQLELARSMSYYASMKLIEPAAQRRRALAQAKLQLGNSMRFVGQQCIQMHGGIGVTDEYIASHYFKRLTVIELTFGDTLHQLGEVSSRMTDTAGVFA